MERAPAARQLRRPEELRDGTRQRHLPDGVSNNLFIIVLSLAIQIPFSLFLAVLLNRRFPGRAIFR
jgi:ABC-type sugar transport system permease subunit